MVDEAQAGNNPLEEVTSFVLETRPVEQKKAIKSRYATMILFEKVRSNQSLLEADIRVLLDSIYRLFLESVIHESIIIMLEFLVRRHGHMQDEAFLTGGLGPDRSWNPSNIEDRDRLIELVLQGNINGHLNPTGAAMNKAIKKAHSVVIRISQQAIGLIIPSNVQNNKGSMLEAIKAVGKEKPAILGMSQLFETGEIKKIVRAKLTHYFDEKKIAEKLKSDKASDEIIRLQSTVNLLFDQSSSRLDSTIKSGEELLTNYQKLYRFQRDTNFTEEAFRDVHKCLIKEVREAYEPVYRKGWKRVWNLWSRPDLKHIGVVNHLKLSVAQDAHDVALGHTDKVPTRTLFSLSGFLCAREIQKSSRKKFVEYRRKLLLASEPFLYPKRPASICILEWFYYLGLGSANVKLGQYKQLGIQEVLLNTLTDFKKNLQKRVNVLKQREKFSNVWHLIRYGKGKLKSTEEIEEIAKILEKISNINNQENFMEFFNLVNSSLGGVHQDGGFKYTKIPGSVLWVIGKKWFENIEAVILETTEAASLEEGFYKLGNRVSDLVMQEAEEEKEEADVVAEAPKEELRAHVSQRSDGTSPMTNVFSSPSQQSSDTPEEQQNGSCGLRRLFCGFG